MFRESAVPQAVDIANTPDSMRPTRASQPPRALGRAYVSSKRRSDDTVALDELHQSGALKLLFPTGRPNLEAVAVNTAGGITGGDQFSLSAKAGSHSTLTLTTQAAERIYRAQPDQIGQMTTRLTVGTRARLNWLPQETILFQNSNFKRTLHVDLAEDAQLLLVEPLVFGRVAMGERLTSLRFHDQIQIRRKERVIFRDAIRFEGDVAAHLNRPGIAGVLSAPCTAMVTLILATTDAEATLAWLRSCLPARAYALGGASLLAPELLHMRLLATDSFVLRQTLLPILDRLTEGNLPRCWRL